MIFQIEFDIVNVKMQQLITVAFFFSLKLI